MSGKKTVKLNRGVQGLGMSGEPSHPISGCPVNVGLQTSDVCPLKKSLAYKCCAHRVTDSPATSLRLGAIRMIEN